MSKRPTRSRPTVVVGWRELVDFPDLGMTGLRAKVDTGARTSALHAEDLSFSAAEDGRRVEFSVPLPGGKIVRAHALLIEHRNIRSSTGHEQTRPVIRTTLRLGEFVYSIEVSLVNRDLMGFPILIGRTALRHRFLVDPAASFLHGGPAADRQKKSVAPPTQ